MPKTFASQAVPDESGRKGALCRGTIVYEVDDGAQKAPYKLKILARFGRIPISQPCSLHTPPPQPRRRYAGQAVGPPAAAHPGNPARRRRKPPKAALPDEQGKRLPPVSGCRLRRLPATRKPPLPKGERGLLLYHQANRCRCYLAFSRISTRRHRLVADSGRVSARSTRSPMPALFSSS